MADDNITQFPGKSSSAVKQANDMLVSRVQGVEAWEATPLLRWHGEVLEQMHRSSTSNSIKWEPVPQVAEPEVI